MNTQCFKFRMDSNISVNSDESFQSDEVDPMQFTAIGKSDEDDPMQIWQRFSTKLWVQGGECGLEVRVLGVWGCCFERFSLPFGGLNGSLGVR